MNFSSCVGFDGNAVLIDSSASSSPTHVGQYRLLSRQIFDGEAMSVAKGASAAPLPVELAVFSPDGNDLAILYRNGKGLDGSRFVNRWSIDQNKSVWKSKFQCGTVANCRSMVFTRDGLVVVICTTVSDRIYFVDFLTGDIRLCHWADLSIWHSDMSYWGHRIAFDQGGDIAILDFATEAPVEVHRLHTNDASVTSIHFRPDDDGLVSTSENRIMIWEKCWTVDGGSRDAGRSRGDGDYRLVKTIQSPLGNVRNDFYLRYNPEENILVMVNRKHGRVSFTDVDTGVATRTLDLDYMLPGIRRILHVGKSVLLTGDSKDVHLMDFRNGKRVHRQKVSMTLPAGYCCSANENDSRICLVEDDWTIHIFQSVPGVQKESAYVSNCCGPLTSAVLSLDGMLTITSDCQGLMMMTRPQH